MSSVNSMAFTGRLGADAELKYTQGGTAIWSARVAVDYGWGDKKGTTWLNAKALGKHAEALGSLQLAKGALIGGSGELQVREYDRREGGKGTSVEVLVHQVALLGPRPDAQSGGGASRTVAPQRAATPLPAADFVDDDIPF